MLQWCQMTQKQIIRKKKISWLLAEDSATAFDKWQATIYHLYEFNNRQPIEALKQAVRDSKPDELDTWWKVIDYTNKMGLRGYATRVRSEWFES